MPGESITETVSINIINFNDAPVLPATAIQLADGTEDTAYNFAAAQLLNGVTDPMSSAEGVKDVDNLKVTGLSATNGTISGNSTDGYTFTPNDNFNGLANINYTIIDGNGGTVTNSVTVNIVAVNDAPTATFDVAQTTTEGNNALTGTLTSADVDSQDQLAEGQAADTATYSLKSAAITDADGNAINDANGVPIACSRPTISDNGSWSFDPAHAAYDSLADGEVQKINVTYQVADTDGLTGENSFVITLTGTNDDPVATFTTAQTATEDDKSLPLYGQLPASDDNGALSYALSATATPIDGLTINSDGSWSFDAAANNTLAIADGDTQTITVALDVTDAQNAVTNSSFDITLTGTANGINIAAPDAANLLTGQLTATDVDATDSITYSLLGADIPGLTINANGSWAFNPSDSAYQGLAEGVQQVIKVNYGATDSSFKTANNSFNITITGTNDIPVVDATAISNLPGGSEGKDYVISKAQLLAGYTDADRDANGNQQALDITGLTATDADGNVVGSFALSAEQDRWTFTPNDYFNGTVKLNYNVTDGTASTAASNSFELASVNDAPELTGVQAVLANGTEDIEYTIKVSDLLAGYTDADNDPIEVFGITSTAGLLTLNSEGDAYTFKPNENISGEVTFDYVVRDKFGGNTIATINLSLDAVNDKPIRTGGNFNTLYLQEDQDPTAIGLQDLNYNPGGGASEANQRSHHTARQQPRSDRQPQHRHRWQLRHRHHRGR